MRRIWPWLRVTVALLLLAALVGQLSTSVGAAVAYHRDVPTTVINFFSFFTVLSNAASVVLLAWAGIVALMPARSWPAPPAPLVGWDGFFATRWPGRCTR